MTREQRVATLAALCGQDFGGPWAATARSGLDATRHAPRRLSLTRPAGFGGRDACHRRRGPDACEEGDGGHTSDRTLDLSRVKEEPRLQGGHSRPIRGIEKDLAV